MSALNQIANYLQIESSLIIRCEEWAAVWFVVIQGKGGRFVSKKVVEVKKAAKYLNVNQIIGIMSRKHEVRVDPATNRRYTSHQQNKAVCRILMSVYNAPQINLNKSEFALECYICRNQSLVAGL